MSSKIFYGYSWISCLLILFPVSYTYQFFGAYFCSCLVLFFFIAFFIFFSRCYEFFSPVFCIVFFSSLYILAPAVGYISTDFDLITPSNYFLKMLPLCLLYLLSLTCAYLIFQSKATSTKISYDVIPNSSVLFLFFILSIILFLSAIQYTKFEISRGELQLVVSLWQRILIYAVLMSGVVAYVVCFVLKKRRVLAETSFFYIGVALVVITFYILGDRRVLVSVILSLLCSVPISKAKKKLFIVALIPGYIASSYYAYLRGVPFALYSFVLEQVDFSQVIGVSRSEFSAWAMVSNDLISLDFLDLFRPSFFLSFFSVVPHILLPNRPFGSSIWYVTQYDPLYYQAGGGYAFCLVLDAYMSFGVFGPLLLGILFGKLIAANESVFSRRVLLVSVLIFSFRSDFSSLIQLVFWGYAFLKLSLLCSKNLSFKDAKLAHIK